MNRRAVEVIAGELELTRTSELLVSADYVCIARALWQLSDTSFDHARYVHDQFDPSALRRWETDILGSDTFQWFSTKSPIGLKRARVSLFCPRRGVVVYLPSMRTGYWVLASTLKSSDMYRYGRTVLRHQWREGITLAEAIMPVYDL